MTLLLQYNKVTNNAFLKLAKCLKNTEIADLTQFHQQIDNLDFLTVKQFLTPFRSFKSAIIGDIFWPTGQNICLWCKKYKVKCYFLQHGQWIYTTNKKMPTHLPYCTFLFGDNVAQMVKRWPYGKRSKIEVIGSPRYDDLTPNSEGDYVYFAPPVIYEKIPSAPDKMNNKVITWLQLLQGLDREVQLVIHPHYREGNVNKLASLFPNAKMIDPAEDPLPLMQKAEKVLTHRNSTSVLDAIACGRPSVLINFEKYDNSFFPRNYFGEFAIDCKWPAECTDALLSDYKLNFDNYVERARPYIFLGNASERISGIIQNGA